MKVANPMNPIHWFLFTGVHPPTRPSTGTSFHSNTIFCLNMTIQR